MTNTNLPPYPEVPIGIRLGTWQEGPDSGSMMPILSLRLSTWKGHMEAGQVVSFSRELVVDHELRDQMIQMTVDHAVLKMLHHMDNALKQPIVDRLEKALMSMKSRSNSCSDYDPRTSEELAFFVRYIEGYVLGKPEDKSWREKNVQFGF